MAGLLSAAAHAAAPALDLKVERTERVCRAPDGKLLRGAQLQGPIVTMGSMALQRRRLAQAGVCTEASARRHGALLFQGSRPT